MFPQQSTNADRELAADNLIEPRVWQETAATKPEEREKSGRRFFKILDHDWITALVYVVCDVAAWVLLYGFVSFARRDAFFVGPFEFVLVDFVPLAVRLQALYIID